MSEARLAIAAAAIVLMCSAAAGAQDATTAATSRPVEAVRIVRGAAVEQGRTAAEAIQGRSLMQDPAYRGWASWGAGTRVVARLDEIDKEGRNFPVQRYAMRLDAIDGDSARVSHFRIMPDGAAGEHVLQVHPAQRERAAIMLARQSPRMIYWRRYEARVAVEKPTSQPADNDRKSRRSRREQARDSDGVPADALPAEFDCAIIETVHLSAPDDTANDDPAKAKAGDELTVIRSYHNVEAPGWEVMVETYQARLGEDGFAADLDLVSRWRIEWILRPSDPDPTAEQLNRGLPPDR